MNWKRVAAFIAGGLAIVAIAGGTVLGVGSATILGAAVLILAAVLAF